MALTRDAFIKAAPLGIKKISNEVLGEVYIREMGGAERDQFEATLTDASGKTQTRGMRARLVMLCLCDKDGERLFTDDDFDMIQSKPANLLQSLVDEIIELNGLKQEDVEGN